MKIDLKQCFPTDDQNALLLGRVWQGGNNGGPCIVLIENESVYDISYSFPIIAELLNEENPQASLEEVEKEKIGNVYSILENTDPESRDTELPFFLAPCDLQAVKACGVTFADSLLERLVEEQAKGDPKKAKQFRDELEQELNFDLGKIEPGSQKAAAVKQVLQQKKLWSQYLEVGIGPESQVFTKAQPLAAIGTGESLGVRADSKWNNPEPEMVLVVNARGNIIGATLGNDVNLRDFEGRSSLLLGKAKENNASCGIGPFIRLFNESFTLDDVRNAEITIEVSGQDGFLLQDASIMEKISRDIEILVSQTIGQHQQYPDGLMLFTGTLFAPKKDRDQPGEGFTHKLEDVVRIASPKLGALVNRVGYCHELPPWKFGITEFFRNLTQRGLI